METKKKFGFIVHCRNLRELRLVAARYRLSPFSLLPAQMLKSHLLKKGYVNDIFTFRNVVSDRQIVCQGKAFCLLMTPEQMLENQNLTTELVKQGCRMA
ncbi:MAG: hypothetical protein GY868_03290, partial [Deltaproteobacteria bacterium]|nr:hypothetical protein [Deltaproteobacteria bacterium]